MIFGAGFPFGTDRLDAVAVDLLRTRNGYIHPLSRIIDGHHNGNSPQPTHVILPQLKRLAALLLGVSLSQLEELAGTRRLLISFPPIFHFLFREPHDCHSCPFPPISLYGSTIRLARATIRYS